MKKRFLSMLVLLVAVATGAYATEFTSLKVGDVIHVGDVINTGIDYKVYGGALDASFQPATLVRGNIGTHDVTESETGAYYLFKIKIDVYPGVIFGNEGYDGGYWPVTDTSDGITVTAITPIDHGYTELTFAVHEGPAASTYSVTLAEGTEDADKWTIEPKTGLNGGETVTATYNGEKKVKSVKAVKKAAAAPITLDNTITAWTAGSYAVPTGGLTYSDAITVSGNVTLVLTDGETLTLNKGISLASGATLTIQGNGTMAVNGTNENTTSTVAGSTGTLILTSGTLTATGGNGLGVDEDEMLTNNRAYAGGNAINGNVTVSGGTLTAIGGNGGSIGDYSESAYGADGGVAISGSVTVTDGTVTATGGNGGSIGFGAPGAEGGSGGAAIGGDATVNGGTWTASNGTNGGGGKAVAGTVTDNR